MANNNLIYDVEDKPGWGKTIVFALQQLLAIMAATIAVPAIVNSVTGSEMSTSAALLGAGVGTIVYLLFTKSKSPVFLGSSFAFLGSMFAAFGGAASMSIGYLGLIIGAVFAGLVYVILALICKFCGTNWISKLMPAVVIGPTVAIIGLSLSANAVANVFGYGDTVPFVASEGKIDLHVGMCIIVGLVTLFTVIITSVYSKPKGFLKLIPFVIGIGVGYLVALGLTGIGYAAENDALKIIDFDIFKNAGWDKFVGGWCPEFTFIKAIESFKDGDFSKFGPYLGTLAVAYVPVAFVVFAEHIADHKNLGSIIGRDLLVEPGLHRTLLGDGVGSMASAFFGGACNTTYGESVGCVAISGNASIRTIWATAVMAIVLAFFLPFSTLLASIPTPVMGGVCIALYGFIAVSGLKMIQKVDLGDNRNLFVVSVILIAGVGGFSMKFVLPDAAGEITLTEVACALILGIIVNVIVNLRKSKENANDEPAEAPAEAANEVEE